MNQHFYGSYVGHKIFSFKALREEWAAAERRAEEERAAHNATKMVCSLNDILDSFSPFPRIPLHFFLHLRMMAFLVVFILPAL